MNLNMAVGALTTGINPMQPISVQVSVGNTIATDATQTGNYATPGGMTASIGGTFAASVAEADPTVLVVGDVLTGSLQVGDIVAGTDGTNALPTSCAVLSQLTGTVGGAGTYQLSAAPATGLLDPCTVTSASVVLNITAVGSGVPQPGQLLADAGGSLTPGTIITGFLSGQRGGPGLYTINQPQTVASELMTTSFTIVAQVQPLAATDIRHMDALNLGGTHRAFYFNSTIRGIVRIALKGGDLLTTPDGSVYYVNQSQEPWEMTAGWAKCIGTLQLGT